jgi:hypothetical protein
MGKQEERLVVKEDTGLPVKQMRMKSNQAFEIKSSRVIQISRVVTNSCKRSHLENKRT